MRHLSGLQSYVHLLADGQELAYAVRFTQFDHISFARLDSESAVESR